MAAGLPLLAKFQSRLTTNLRATHSARNLPGLFNKGPITGRNGTGTRELLTMRML